MQIKYLHKGLYQLQKIDETEYSPIVYERFKKLESYEELMQDGGYEESILVALEVSRASIHRWKKRYREEGLAGLENDSRRPRRVRHRAWTREMESRVYTLRCKYPLYGKYKITVLYKRTYGLSMSVSTTGRIITHLLKKGRIKSVQFMCGEREFKPRNFSGHAQRWRSGMKSTEPGEMIQFDHMTRRLPSGRTIKHFKATCPTTKISVEHVYESATSNNGAHFFAYAQNKFPFPILSVQVDGGGEFMGEFEATCQKAQIPLFVLPPRSPELNGCIERSNRTVKTEFYSQYDGPSDLKSVQKALEEYGIVYNTIRPHQALQYSTPMEYYKIYTQKEALQSHMY
jgi:putative transposase